MPSPAQSCAVVYAWGLRGGGGSGRGGGGCVERGKEVLLAFKRSVSVVWRLA